MKNKVLLYTGIVAIASACLVMPGKSLAADVEPFKVTVTGSGPPMILIPGLASGPNVWDGTVAHYKDHYQCHVLTLAGFAGQPPMDGPFLDKVRDGIVKYIHDKHLNHPVIIGHSLGGMMAFWLGETAPKDIGPIVAVDGVPFFAGLRNPDATAEDAKGQAEQMRGMYAGISAEKYAENNHMFLSMMITDKTNIDKVASLGDKSNPKAVGQAFYDLFTTDLRPNTKLIESPVLLIGSYSGATGDDQKSIHDAYEAQVSKVPHHKVVFAPTAKHFIQLDDPAFFYSTVDAFLKANKK